MKFFISCDPPTSTSAGAQGGVAIIGGKARRFKPKAAKQSEAIWVSLLKDNAPERPIEGPVSLRIILTWTWRASESQRVKDNCWAPKDTKPDADNLAKTLLDAMQTTGYFLNDSQVASFQVVKGWGNKPGISVDLTPFRFDIDEIIGQFQLEVAG